MVDMPVRRSFFSRPDGRTATVRGRDPVRIDAKVARTASDGTGTRMRETVA